MGDLSLTFPERAVAGGAMNKWTAGTRDWKRGYKTGRGPESAWVKNAETYEKVRQALNRIMYFETESVINKRWKMRVCKPEYSNVEVAFCGRSSPLSNIIFTLIQRHKRVSVSSSQSQLVVCDWWPVL